MPMRVVCAKCGKQFSAWEDLVGKQVQCPKCQHIMVLGGANPLLDTPPTPSQAPPQKANPVGQPSKTRPPSSAPPQKENPKLSNPVKQAPRIPTAPPAAKTPPRTTPLPRAIPA